MTEREPQDSVPDDTSADSSAADPSEDSSAASGVLAVVDVAKTAAGKPVAGKPVPRRRGRTLFTTLAGVALLGGGLGLGLALSDPTGSTEYLALQEQAETTTAERDQVIRDRTAIAADLKELQQNHSARDAAASERETAVAAAEAALAAREDAVGQREAAATAAAQVKAQNSFGDGTRTVGVDIEAGTYRPTADVSSSCYWAIYVSGSNGDDIITNDIPGGGRPTVSIAAGQDFNSTRCGTWTKQ